MEFKRYIVFCEVGYVTMGGVYALSMPADHTKEELDDACWEQAVDHAEMYGIYPYPEDNDFDEEDDCYSDNISGYPEEYDPKKHDGQRAGGGSFLDDFEKMER